MWEKDASPHAGSRTETVCYLRQLSGCCLHPLLGGLAAMIRPTSFLVARCLWNLPFLSLTIRSSSWWWRRPKPSLSVAPHDCLMFEVRPCPRRAPPSPSRHHCRSHHLPRTRRKTNDQLPLCNMMLSSSACLRTRSRGPEGIREAPLPLPSFLSESLTRPGNDFLLCIMYPDSTIDLLLLSDV